MSRNAVQLLESARLAEYAGGPLRCYICDTENLHDAEFCAECYAPLALAQQARSQGVEPRMVAAVGTSDTGKTVYLGMLMDMLSRRAGPIQMFARGAFSITLQQTTVYALARSEFPQKTPNEPERWNWVHCQVRHPDRKHPLELIMPDMAGEAVLQEVDHPSTHRVVQSFLGRAGAAMVFLDGAKLKQGRLEQDHFSMKLLSYLGELECDPARGWSRRPVALVFTKADECEECLDDPDTFARTHAAGLWQQCQERFTRHRFFGATVAGATAYRDLGRRGRVQVPLRVEPRGVVEPFLWILENM
jgi:hypothetical protein